MELFIVFIGTTKYTYWKFLLYNGLSKLLKLIIMAVFINYLMYNEAQLLSFHFFDFVRGIIEFMLSIIKI
jgi:membrane protein DedA with SNARE-associated domain